MSYVESAIERLNNLIENSQEGSAEQIDYVVMKQACEKQLAEKPLTTIRPQNAFKDLGVCPVCKHAVWQYTNYCDECGQKINWEE